MASVGLGHCLPCHEALTTPSHNRSYVVVITQCPGRKQCEITNIVPFIIWLYFLLYGKLAESETCFCANITEAVPDGWLCLWHSIQFPGCASDVK